MHNLIQKFFVHPAMRFGVLVVLFLMVYFHEHLWVSVVGAAILVLVYFFNAGKMLMEYIELHNRCTEAEKRCKIFDKVLWYNHQLIEGGCKELEKVNPDMRVVTACLAMAGLYAETARKDPDEADELVDFVIDAKAAMSESSITAPVAEA